MGERNKTTQAVILTVKDQGENNRLICALSPDAGIFYAVLYGGPKSKLRSLVQPFNMGTIWLYDDEVRHSKKITDFDPKFFPETFRTDLYKIWAANLAGELVLKTKCAGDSQESFTLLSAFLKGIDVSEESEARLGTIRFLWRYLGLLGIQPEVHLCHSCGSSLLRTERDSYFINSINSFVCSECFPSYRESVSKNNSAISCDCNGLTYLEAINSLSPGQVRRMSLPAESAFKMKRAVFHILESSSLTRLNSLENGQGIL